MSAIHSLHSFSRDAKVPFRSPSAFGSRVAEVRLNAAFRFQTIKRRIDRTYGDFSADAFFNLVPHRDPVGLITETQERQNDNVFEFAEVVATGH